MTEGLVRRDGEGRRTSPFTYRGEFSEYNKRGWGRFDRAGSGIVIDRGELRSYNCRAPAS
jgi:hypothetical protein